MSRWLKTMSSGIVDPGHCLFPSLQISFSFYHFFCFCGGWFVLRGIILWHEEKKEWSENTESCSYRFILHFIIVKITDMKNNRMIFHHRGVYPCDDFNALDLCYYCAWNVLPLTSLTSRSKWNEIKEARIRTML